MLAVRQKEIKEKEKAVVEEDDDDKISKMIAEF